MGDWSNTTCNQTCGEAEGEEAESTALSPGHRPPRPVRPSQVTTETKEIEAEKAGWDRKQAEKELSASHREAGGYRAWS